LDVKEAVYIGRTLTRKREEMTTMKYGCVFKVKSYLLSCEQWSLNVVNGEHNHEMTQDFQGHKYVE
jgi:hypothetical protein